MYISQDGPTVVSQAGDLAHGDSLSVVGAHNPTGPCMGCGVPIFERHFLAVADRSWHVDCLQCCICMARLEGQLTCYIKDGMVFCRDDYHRQFSKRCSRCRRPIGCKDLVMRARECVYHIQCFTCIICNSSLQPGEYFALGDQGSLYCQSHYEPLLAMASAAEAERTSQAMGHTPMLTTASGVQKGRPKKRKNGRLGSGSNLGFGPLGHGLGSCMVSSSGGDMGMGHGGGSPTGSGRTKRMRTSFKHHQLRSMKAYFALNHNPDAKDLKQLAQKTGLTKRVLQVWFQNARAKYRRATQMRSGSAGSENLNPCSPKSIPETSSEHNTSFSDTNTTGRPAGEEGSQSATPALVSRPISSEGDSLLGSPEDPSAVDGGEGNPFSADINDDSASRTLAEYFENERGLL